MRTQAEFRLVRRLLTAGLPDAAITRQTGVPESTVANWRRRGSQRHERRLLANPEWRPEDPASYCYLLGLYLGDGHLVVRRSALLRISLDAAFPGIIREATRAIGCVIRNSPVRSYRFGSANCTVLQVSHPALPFAFPQHGVGPKHLRPIELRDWQRDLTHRHPEALLRGLIHSDGCRCINRFRTLLPSGRIAAYEYPRYFFSNLSDHIRAIFCEHCELLEINWTRSNPRNISISDRRSVARLDSFIGPKT